MWTPMAMRKIVMSPKKIIAWTRMEIPLVCMFPNSTTLFLPGNWNNNPGLNNTNSTTAITTGPQSAILTLHTLLEWIKLWKKVGCGWKKQTTQGEREIYTCMSTSWVLDRCQCNNNVATLWIVRPFPMTVNCNRLSILC